MAVIPFFLPYSPVFNSNGLPVAGAQVYFYAPGTSTKLPVYADAEMQIELPNPVVADSAARLPAIYMPSADYRVVIRGKGLIAGVPGPLLAEFDPYIPVTTENSAQRAEEAAVAAEAAEGVVTSAAGIVTTLHAEVVEARTASVGAALSAAGYNTTAEGHAEQAGLYAAAAEASIDGKLFASDTDGVAATTDGDFFLVKGEADGEIYATLWKNETGAGVVQDLEIPSLAAVRTVIATRPPLVPLFWNAALDDDPDLPLDAVSRRLTGAVETTDPVFVNAGFTRVLPVAAGATLSIQRYFEDFVSVGDWVMVSAVVQSAGAWPADTIAATQLKLGADGFVQQQDSKLDWVAIDATHRRYFLKMQVGLSKPAERVMLTFVAGAAALKVGAFAVGVSKTEPFDLDWHRPDPLGVGSLQSRVASYPPTLFTNGNFDPALPGPNFIFGSSGTPQPTSSAFFRNRNFTRVVPIAPGDIDFVEVVFDRYVRPGAWIAVAVLVETSVAGQWPSAITNRSVNLGFDSGGGGIYSSVYGVELGREEIDATHSIYSLVFRNEMVADAGATTVAPGTPVPAQRLHIKLGNDTPATLRWAGFSVAVADRRMDGVDISDPDPGARAALTAAVASQGGGTGPIVVLGDSLAEPLVAPMAPASGRPVVNRAIGGRVSGQIVREVTGVRVRLAGAIVNAGVNSVTHLDGATVASLAKTDAAAFLSTPSHNISVSRLGVLGSVRGTLTRSVTGGAETYSFTPADGETTGRRMRDDTVFQPDFPAGAWVLASLGRNNFLNEATVASDVRTLRDLCPRLTVFAIPNAHLAGEAIGESNYIVIQRLNATLAHLLGQRFIDNVAVKKDKGLALAGLPEGPNDPAYRAQDRVSLQLQPDGLHPNAAAAAIDVDLAVERAARLGF